MLFQRACGIESSDLPPEDGVEVSIGRSGLLGEDDNGGDEEEVRLVETIESNLSKEGSGDGMHRPIVVDFDYEPPPYDELTLKLVFRNVNVLDVQGIGYETKPLTIHRYQLPKPKSLTRTWGVIRVPTAVVVHMTSLLGRRSWECCRFPCRA